MCGAIAACASIAAGLVSVWLFGSLAGVDTRPPTCWNGPGGAVPCSRDNGRIFLMTTTVCLALIVASAYARRLGRRRAGKVTPT